MKENGIFNSVLLRWTAVLMLPLAAAWAQQLGEGAADITNHWGVAETVRISTEEVVVQHAVEGRSYHHHCQMAAQPPYFFLAFSSGAKNEDDVGQEVFFTRSRDGGVTWDTPRGIVKPPMGEHAPFVATATGLRAFYDPESGGRLLAAYYGLYEYQAGGLADGARRPGDANHQNTRCMVILSEDDGVTWSAPRLVAENVVCNLGPQLTASGRLIMPANVVFLHTDDPSGLSGWVRAALPGIPPEHPDDSAGFARLFAEDPDRFGFCEGSMFQTDNGVLRMMLRTNRPQLAVTESADNGMTWSPARMTRFSDNGSRHQFGRLPDGRYFALSTPDPENRGARTPLVLALSRDGVSFDRHFVVGDAPAHPPKFSGHAKGGRFGYPHLAVMDGVVVAAYSVAKEDVAVCRFPLSRLD